METLVDREDIIYITDKGLPWESLTNCTILVSGANGFLPSFMIETLLYLNDRYDKNIKIFALVRDKKKASIRFRRYLNRKDFKFIVQDICSPITVESQVDYIIHAASPANSESYKKDPVGTVDANILGTRNFLELAREKKVKGFLYFSTGGVLGRIEDNNIPAKEEDYGYINPMEVYSCYSLSKKMAENICFSWFKQYGVPVRIVRPSYVYGGGFPLGDSRAFSNFISNILNNEPITVVDGDKRTRSFCYIADATLAFFTVLLKGKDGESYNVGVEQETSIKQLASDMVKIAGNSYSSRVIYKTTTLNKQSQRGSVDRSCFDITKVSALGWTPRYTLSEGMRRVFNFYGL